MWKLNKKRADLSIPIVIFLVLNIAFFSMMMLFVQRVSSNALIYEESFSKEIGLILNRAEPGMSIKIDVTKLIETAIENGVELEEIQRLIQIDTEKGIVTVRAKKEEGFSFPYFSNVTLEKPNGEIVPIIKENKLTEAHYFLKIK